MKQFELKRGYVRDHMAEVVNGEWIRYEDHVEAMKRAALCAGEAQKVTCPHCGASDVDATPSASPVNQVQNAHDAARYRWLVYNAKIEARKFINDGFDPCSTKQPLDNAIDAAMSSMQSEEK